MFTGKVIGTLVATRKDEKLAARKLLVVQPVDGAGRTAGKPIVAADTAGAGPGETVLLCRSGDASRATDMAPVDAAIIGIVDETHLPVRRWEPDWRALGFRSVEGGR